MGTKDPLWPKYYVTSGPIAQMAVTANSPDDAILYSILAFKAKWNLPVFQARRLFEDVIAVSEIGFWRYELWVRDTDQMFDFLDELENNV